PSTMSDFIVQVYPFANALQAWMHNVIEWAWTTSTAGDEVQKAVANLIGYQSFFVQMLLQTKRLFSADSPSATPAAVDLNALLAQVHIRWKELRKRIAALLKLIPELEQHSAAGASSAASSLPAHLTSSFVTFQSFLHQ